MKQIYKALLLHKLPQIKSEQVIISQTQLWSLNYKTLTQKNWHGKNIKDFQDLDIERFCFIIRYVSNPFS